MLIIRYTLFSRSCLRSAVVHFVHSSVVFCEHQPNLPVIQHFTSGEYVKIGWLGIVGVDKMQRVVKMRHLLVFEAKTANIYVSVFDAEC